MKRYTKFSFPVLTLLLTSQLFAQGQAPQPDEGMDIFLQMIALIAIGIMCGAAMVGAFTAALVIGLIALFGSLGLLSISFLVGLYKRSLAAGFKTFIALFFAVICSATGTVAALFLQQIVAPEISVLLLLAIGFISGGLGGLLIGFSAFKIIRTGLAYLTKRMTVN